MSLDSYVPNVLYLDVNRIVTAWWDGDWLQIDFMKRVDVTSHYEHERDRKWGPKADP